MCGETILTKLANVCLHDPDKWIYIGYMFAYTYTVYAYIISNLRMKWNINRNTHRLSQFW